MERCPIRVPACRDGKAQHAPMRTAVSHRSKAALSLIMATLLACGGEQLAPADAGRDAPALDATPSDSGADAAAHDAGAITDDASTSLEDAGAEDAGAEDAGAEDAAAEDAATEDAATEDAATEDAGMCAGGTSASCDDSNPCTYGDACSAGVCAGTALACDSMDTQCRDYTCDGDPTCASSPRTGAACDDGNALTAGDTCDASGTCVGASVCTLPPTACADGAESRIGCGTSGTRVIGRRTAAGAVGALINGNTCTAASAFNGSDCAYDGGPDHAYRIWLRAGETLTVDLRRQSDCDGGAATWDATLKLFESTGCGDVTCGADLWCHDHVGSGSYPYTATHDGWIVLVVDGVAGVGDEGAYRLQARLTGCAAPGCEC